jgi:exodeoxyribonuclease V alpha subunit
MAVGIHDEPLRRVRGEVLRITARNEDTLWSVLVIAPQRISPRAEREEARLKIHGESPVAAPECPFDLASTNPTATPSAVIPTEAPAPAAGQAAGNGLISGAFSDSLPLDPAILPPELSVVVYSNATEGQILTAHGKLVDSRFGKQFKAVGAVAENPVNPAGIARYLGSGFIQGIGPALAGRIVEAFGVDSLRVIRDEPERLASIKGLGLVRCTRISDEWKAQEAQREIMLFFHSQGISGALARRIHKTYGDDAIDVVRENPYRLCSEVRGIGFRIADGISNALGVPRNAPQRIDAGIAYVMEEINTSGSTGARESVFVEKASQSLEVKSEDLLSGLERTVSALAPAGDGGEAQASPLLPLLRVGSTLFHAGLARQEALISKFILRRAGVRPLFADRFSPSMIDAVSSHSVTLSSAQRRGIESVFANGVSIITGGPGCGKTTTLSVLTQILEQMKLSFAFAAPTGKAAQRISETTGREAATIHRLLKLRPGSTDAQVVEADVLILDECSMVDVPLMSIVLRNLSKKTVLVLVGDADQLPSVGPGRVMGDLIDSGRVASTRLDFVFRQGAGSQIKIAARDIRHGEFPTPAGRDGDFFILHEGNTPEIAAAMALPDEEERPGAVARVAGDLIADLVLTRVAKRYGFAWQDIQVLSPMNKGAVGVIALNRRLQAALNGPERHPGVKPAGIPYGGERLDLYPGDRVIQTSNNYDLEIFNGDTGYIRAIDHQCKVIQVDFGRMLVNVPFDFADELRPAYAITIHKSQGSEAPVVIMPMVTQHWNMLQRDLLYTGLTRAKKLAIIVGQKRAIAAAVRNVGGNNRVTRLLACLNEQG